MGKYQSYGDIRLLKLWYQTQHGRDKGIYVYIYIHIMGYLTGDTVIYNKQHATVLLMWIWKWFYYHPILENCLWCFLQPRHLWQATGWNFFRISPAHGISRGPGMGQNGEYRRSKTIYQWNRFWKPWDEKGFQIWIRNPSLFGCKHS